MAQDELEDKVRKRLTVDGHLKLVAVREVNLAFSTRRMLLGKVNLLRLAVKSSPVSDSTLKRSYLALLEMTRILGLEEVEEGCGL